MEEHDLEFEGEETLNVLNQESNSLEKIYPQADIKVEREQYSIFELKRKYDRGLIVLNPDFQRNDVWKNRQKSELVESVLMGIPLPMFYFAENREGQLVVVDGRQRLTSFFKFMDNELTLTPLRILRDIGGKKFMELDARMQASLEDFQLMLQIIKPSTPDRIKFDIFDRVNRGGTNLNNQEMRNALYLGKSTNLLKNMAATEEFKAATNRAISSSRMKDQYIILRFFAFYLWNKKILLDEKYELVQYKSDIDDFLGKTMEFLNRQEDVFIQDLQKMFLSAMCLSYNVLGEDGFRLPSSNERRRPINMALFESITYLLVLCDGAESDVNVRLKYDELLQNQDFLDSLTARAVDSSTKVKSRFDFVERAWRGICSV